MRALASLRFPAERPRSEVASRAALLVATLRIMSTLQITGETPRCWWCGQKLSQESHHIQFEVFGKPYDTTVCSPTHEQAVTAAYRYIHRVFPVFWAGITLSIALLVSSNFVRWSTWLN